MIVDSDNYCEFCGKKMLTQIYKESYGEYKCSIFAQTVMVDPVE